MDGRSYDPETGEIVERIDRHMDMPPEIAAAIIEVSSKVKRLGTDERNPHGGYPYVSVDKFYEVIGPLMAQAGLYLMVNEIEGDVRDGGSGKGWLFARYELYWAHKSGAVSPPLMRRIALPISGPQAFGAAQSYVEKQFMRQTFKIATGEKDADETAPDDAPARRPERRQQRQATPPAERVRAPAPWEMIGDPVTDVAPEPEPEIFDKAAAKKQASAQLTSLREAIGQADAAGLDAILNSKDMLDTFALVRKAADTGAAAEATINRLMDIANRRRRELVGEPAELQL